MAEKYIRPAGIRATTAFFPELEALRGWAILLVFLFHADGVITPLIWLKASCGPRPC